VTDYVWRGGKLFASRSTQGGARHFALDHLGTVRLVTDDFGLVAERHAYFPFGEEATVNTSAEPMRFTGHERDLQSTPADAADDLDYMHARFNSPLTGRFLAVDAHAGTASAPQSWNRYAYGRANPLKLVDPTGNDVILANRPVDLGLGHHAFLIVQLTGANKALFGKRAVNGRVFLSGGPGVVEGMSGSRLVKWYRDRLTEKTQLLYIKPKRQTKQEFERNVIAAWDSYADGSAHYHGSGWGSSKNSNSLASGVLDAAGAGDAKPSGWELEGINSGWNNPVELSPTHISSVFNSLGLGPLTSSWQEPFEEFFAGSAILEGVEFAPARSR
jgi:RHS repeat-associated protein